MSSRTQTPVHAVCFCAFLSLLLGLISFAGPLAITAVFTMSVVCQYIGFTIPIIARYVGGSEFIHGPFNLGIMVCTTCLSFSAYWLSYRVDQLHSLPPAICYSWLLSSSSLRHLEQHHRAWITPLSWPEGLFYYLWHITSSRSMVEDTGSRGQCIPSRTQTRQIKLKGFLFEN